MIPYTVLIASVLKPANDVRMFYKIGASLAENGANVHVAGYVSNLKPKKDTQVQLHPIFNFKRVSLARLRANIAVLKLAFRLKPQLFIVSTHELLPAAAILKLLKGVNIIYDVRENYYRNIRFGKSFPASIRLLLAGLVRLVEYTSYLFVDHYLLAEQTYAQEMHFFGRRFTVIENKFLPVIPLKKPKYPITLSKLPNINLLYSGTVAILYGIYEAIDLVDKLYKIDNRYTLYIIGYAAQPEVFTQIKKRVAGKPYIFTLISDKQPIPYPEIATAIQAAHIGLLPYQPNPSTENCIPTKLYEYLANSLPIISQPNPLWQKMINKANAGFTIGFSDIRATEVHAQIMNQAFYTAGFDTDVLWENEDSRLLRIIENIMK